MKIHQRRSARRIPEEEYAILSPSSHPVLNPLDQQESPGRGQLIANTWSRRLKRIIDIAGAVGGMALLSPVAGAVSIGVLRSLGRPIIYRQCRPGLGGEPFTVYKFRTMTNGRDGFGVLLADLDRLTSTGRLLRRWSLDELPELWNVLKGDMSLVGPRPLLVDYLDLYTDEQMRRHEMRPGLTGLAQVSGRNDQSWEDRLASGRLVCRPLEPVVGCEDLALTVAQGAFGRRDVSAPGRATMTRFEGNPDE